MHKHPLEDEWAVWSSDNPIWGTHLEITLCPDDALPPGWTVLPPLPTP